MQEQQTIGSRDDSPWDALPGQSLAALLALVGSKRMDAEELRRKTKLTYDAFVSLLAWLQREFLVDVVPTLDERGLGGVVILTERGEDRLLRMLERTCELPELM